MSVENQTQQLRLNVTNIHSFLLSKNKEQQKFRRDKINLQKRKISFEKKQQEEKILESVKTSSIANIAQNVAESPKIGILDKIFNFGGLLLTGILVNAVDKIVEEGKKFYNNNKKLFDTIGNFLSSVKDAVVGLLDSFTGPESEKGAFDHIGKFNADGTLIRFEKEEEKSLLQKIEEAYDSLGTNLNKIEKAVGGKGTIGNFLKDPPPPASEKTPPAAAKTPPATTPATTPPPATATSSGQYGSLLDFIGSGEGGYNSMNQGTRGNSIVGSTNNASSKLGKNLTDMTIGEIMDRQAYLMNRNNPQISDYGIFAAGKYQIIPGTMPGAVRGAGLSRSDKFTPQNQDKLGMALIMNKRPYVGKYLRGEHDDVHGAMMELAREFASMPNPNTGRSLYGSGNKAFHSVDEVREALIKARTKPQPKITPVPNKGNQAAAVNTPDPRDRRNRRGRIIALQRVNTLVPYTITVPVSSSSSGSSTPITNPLAWA